MTTCNKTIKKTNAEPPTLFEVTYKLSKAHVMFIQNKTFYGFNILEVANIVCFSSILNLTIKDLDTYSISKNHIL